MKNNRGMTLLEIMVVVAIIAGMVTLALPRLGNNNYQLKSSVRKITVLSRELHNHAKLKNITFRLVINMIPSEGDQAGQYEYWVESSQEKTINLTKNEDDEEKTDKDGNPIDPDGFQIDTSLIKSKVQLPNGLSFSSVEVGDKNDSITEGLAYIHYLPQGLVEEAAIHLEYGDSKVWTIAIHPLTGRADIIGKKVSLDDIREQ